jgi:ribosomal protein L11 methylase PrmA
VPAEAAAEAGSFRDPAGRVFRFESRVFRTVRPPAAADYAAVRASGLLERWIGRGDAVATSEVAPEILGAAAGDAVHVLEHAPVPVVSYPYEWPFALLRSAALLHLDLQLEALDAGFAFSDASAYNIQFHGVRPVLIDVLSLRRYREGEHWIGHRQFCEQFLNPLLLRALLGVPYQAWYRGELEGVPTAALGLLLPLRRLLSWNLLAHVVLPARAQRRALARGGEAEIARVRGRRLPKSAYRGLLVQLRSWIARLEPRDAGRTAFTDYEREHSYAEGEEAAKRAFVGAFVERARPGLLVDLGCNTGAYAELALERGARRVLGFDVDHGALEAACARARARNLDFLPLFLDAANPSPGQGWGGVERMRVEARLEADAVLALALVHHLAIGRNLPLPEVVAWIVGLAPRGVIEFVHKTDPTVRTMLALREDVFADYHEEAFRAALLRVARIERAETVSASGRRLYWYDAT